jgi:hypothetical protein
LLAQPFNRVITNKTGSAGNQNSHSTSLLFEARFNFMPGAIDKSLRPVTSLTRRPVTLPVQW